MTAPIRVVLLIAALAVTSAQAASPAAMHVAVVGDSLAFGAGDESGKGIAGRLELELRRRGVGSIVAKNLGVNGATTRDLAAKLRQPATRSELTRASAIVLSIGANDLRLLLSGEQPLRSPLLVEDILGNVEQIVADLRGINPTARILILGAYAPVAHERAAAFLEPLIVVWDTMLAAQFAGDPLISVVPLTDIVDKPERLSKIDSFHPGGEAYQETAVRIADLLSTR